MKSCSFPFLFFLLMTHASLSYSASAINRKFERMATTLAGQRPTGTKSVVAILPFNSNSKLARQNLGIAFAEILSHHLVREGKFRVVERAQMEKILSEQRLQQSGAIDSDSAVQLGHVLGAQFVVVGSVEKLEEKYQANARLVDVKSAEVQSSAFEEFPATLFETEAKPYLKLVPKTQTIGLYAAFLTGSESASLPTKTAVRDNGFGFPINNTIDPKSIRLNFVGAGIRYAPWQWIYLDAAYFTPTSNEVVGRIEQDSGFGSPVQSDITLDSSWAARFLIGGRFSLTKCLFARAAVGAMRYHLTANDDLSIASFSAKLNETKPHAALGLEFHPQERIGLGLNANYTFGDLEMTLDSHPEIVIFEAENLQIEINLSIAF